MRALAAEFRKATTLPAVGVGALVSVGASLGITLLNAGGMRADGGADGWVGVLENASNSMLLAVVGVVVIGVVVATSEYAPPEAESAGGRQILTTLAATPQRLAIVGAKTVTVAALAAATAAAAWVANLSLTAALIGHMDGLPTLGEAVNQGLREVLYATLMALIAFAIGLLARSGTVPLALLILNSSVVSLSLLLSTLTPHAFWLPDAAGRAMVMDVAVFRDTATQPPPEALTALTGGLTMGAWTLALLAVAAWAFRRRDA